MFELLEQPGIGRYLMPGLPIEFGAFAREAPRAAPVLGQHTDEILAEVMGLGSAEIGRLHDAGRRRRAAPLIAARGGPQPGRAPGSG